jgi:anti-anti-sigma factor
MENGARFRIDHELDPEIEGGVIVRLAGALEVNGADELWLQTSQLAGPETRFFLFDLSRLNIVTSAGVGMFVRLFVRLQTFGGAIAVFGCSDKVHEVFTVVMLGPTLNVCATEAQARERLKG